MPDVLEIEGLSAGYGEALVLSGVSLTIAEGSAMALLGRNGMGKTTLVNSVIGVTRRFGGTIRLDGRDITPLRPDRRAHAGIGWVPQERNIFCSMSRSKVWHRSWSRSCSAPCAASSGKAYRPSSSSRMRERF